MPARTVLVILASVSIVMSAAVVRVLGTDPGYRALFVIFAFLIVVKTMLDREDRLQSRHHRLFVGPRVDSTAAGRRGGFRAGMVKILLAASMYVASQLTMGRHDKDDHRWNGSTTSSIFRDHNRTTTRDSVWRSKVAAKA